MNHPKSPQPTSIAQRLVRLFAIVNLFSVGTTALGLFIVLSYSTWSSFTNELTSVGQVVAATSRAALAFDDPETGQRVLEALSSGHKVSDAVLLRPDGSEFARLRTTVDLPASSQAFPPPPVAPPPLGKLAWTLSSVSTHQPVELDGEIIGSLLVTSSLDSFYKQLLLVVGVLGVIVVFVLVGLRAFSRSLKRRVLQPIENLRGLAQAVSITKDFSHRLESTSDDEINMLIKAFNHMLAQLEERDRSLVLAVDRAKQADAAKSMFVANMSHELRTPLHAILGMTGELLLSELSAQQQDILKTVRAAGDSLLSIINDILDFSKIEAGKLSLNPEPVLIRDFISSTCQLFQVVYQQKTVALSYHVHSDVAQTLVADRGRLSQILVNLLGNALKFTPEGGAVTVDVRLRDVPAGQPKGVSGGQKYLYFSINDSGIGIPREKLDRVFEVFTQVHATVGTQKGTGLGLAIVSRLVKLMGGWVWVDSVEGKGSSFQFVIEYHPAEPAAPMLEKSEIPSAEEVQYLPAGLRVLVVEDNPVNQKLARLMLERAGCTVIVAENGLKALKVIDNQPIDVTIMDVNMPVMDGLECTRKIRARERLSDRHMPIIALTAGASVDNSKQCFEAGMDAFLPKPISKKTLFETINRQLNASALLSPEL